ncbi:fad-type 2 protein [Rutstroemia sp. NJR-2017a WRK4]|nr:fad-type 2 protein [Rutstroemia sp. NJR-2017a WRK4]
MQLSPISVDTKCEILKNLWNLDLIPSQFYDSHFDYEIYFAYYTDQCSLALHDGGRHILLRTHRDVVDIASHIKCSLSREDIVQILHSKFPTTLPSSKDMLANASVDLAARLLLMMDFGCPQYGFTHQTQITWATKSLNEAVKEYFSTSSGPNRGSSQDSMRLERVFSARNLERIAGIQIEWTTNLADHLRLTDEEDKISIFHYASFLECQLKSSIFPKGLIEETLQTISLLFPPTEKQTKLWFKTHSSTIRLDKNALRRERLKTEDRKIENLRFWRERLVILKQFFDDTEPNTLSQWWYDRRKGVQWYTFWVAVLVLVLTIFFGLIQCIEGALQVYKAFHP